MTVAERSGTRDNAWLRFWDGVRLRSADARSSSS